MAHLRLAAGSRLTHERMGTIKAATVRLAAGYYYDSLLISSLNFPLTLLIILLHLLLVEYLLLAFDIESLPLEALSRPTFKILLIVSVVLFADRFLHGLLHRQTTRSEALMNSKVNIISYPVRAINTDQEQPHASDTRQPCSGY